jgi:hypothetical protein
MHSKQLSSRGPLMGESVGSRAGIGFISPKSEKVFSGGEGREALFIGLLGLTGTEGSFR